VLELIEQRSGTMLHDPPEGDAGSWQTEIVQPFCPPVDVS
jgi:hypothetical protein